MFCIILYFTAIFFINTAQYKQIKEKEHKIEYNNKLKKIELENTLNELIEITKATSLNKDEVRELKNSSYKHINQIRSLKKYNIIC